MAKTPGYSRVRHNGILTVPKGFLRVPYCLIGSEDFEALNELAVKIYFILLRRWATHNPDDPVEMSYEKIREKTGKGYSQISKALKQLHVYGFVYKETVYKKCNRYWIEQKRFTGEYRQMDLVNL